MDNRETKEPATSDKSAGSLEALSERILKKARQRAADRTERRARFDEIAPKPSNSIVAWIDLLGFREQIVAADTQDKFQAAYRRIREFQEEFDKETASLDPGQADINENFGLRIVALSDGLVIAINLEEGAVDGNLIGFYDRVGFFLDGLRLAQARCASVGNFLRGGIALGPFWFEDDILLSPALVSAYEMETKFAKQPVIILERDIAEGLGKMKQGAGYAKDSDPMEDLFRDCEWMENPSRSKYVMLNFMPLFLDNEDPAPHLREYYQHLLVARDNAPEKARMKYDWLISHAHEFVASELPQLEEAIFASPRTLAVRGEIYE